jgi:hypothetical protein
MEPFRKSRRRDMNISFLAVDALKYRLPYRRSQEGIWGGEEMSRHFLGSPGGSGRMEKRNQPHAHF